MRLLSASLSLSLSLLLSGTDCVHGQEEMRASAFDAIRLLTPGQQAALAMVVGRGGKPVPERWHLLAHDPSAEGGLREFVVAGRKVVASRTVSQFAETLTPGAVFEPGSITIDSDRAASMAGAFCRVNDLKAGAYHYDLRRGGATGAALWTIICVTEGNEELGRVVVSAATGAVIVHPGFNEEPAKEDLAGKSPPAASRDEAEDRTESAPRRPRPKSSKPRERPIPRAEPVTTAEKKKPGLFRRIFGGGDR